MNGGIDVIHPRQGNEMMFAAGVRIFLGQLHLIPPLQLIDGATIYASIALRDNSRQWLVVPSRMRRPRSGDRS
jgi:hypothetical protein